MLHLFLLQATVMDHVVKPEACGAPKTLVNISSAKQLFIHWKPIVCYGV